MLEVAEDGSGFYCSVIDSCADNRKNEARIGKLSQAVLGVRLKHYVLKIYREWSLLNTSEILNNYKPSLA